MAGNIDEMQQGGYAPLPPRKPPVVENAEDDSIEQADPITSKAINIKPPEE